MPLHDNLTTAICAAALVLVLAACGGSGESGGTASGSTPDETTTESAVALAEALEAAGRIDADGTFDDTSRGVAPMVSAAHDGGQVAIEAMETGTPRGGTARSGDFVEQDDGPASISSWTGARFRRGAANEPTEHLVVYTDVGAPEAMPFTPENLNRLNEVSGLTGETVPASGLTIVEGWFPVIRSTSLAAADARGSVTYGTTGTGADEAASSWARSAAGRARTTAPAPPAQ